MVKQINEIKNFKKILQDTISAKNFYRAEKTELQIIIQHLKNQLHECNAQIKNFNNDIFVCDECGEEALNHYCNKCDLHKRTFGNI